PVLRARRPAHDLDRIERPGLDEVQKRVHAAALRAVRGANTIDEDVDFFAGKAADEDAGHRRARPLKLHTGLTLDSLGDGGGDAGCNVLGIDDADRLASAAGFFDVVGGGGAGGVPAGGARV